MHAILDNDQPAVSVCAWCVVLWTMKHAATAGIQLQSTVYSDCITVINAHCSCTFGIILTEQCHQRYSNSRTVGNVELTRVLSERVAEP